jgi:hypothetical protein
VSGLRERVAKALNTPPHFWGVTVGVEPERVAAFWESVADALLPLIAAERDEAARQARAEERREWQEWSNELALLIPEDDVCDYANPEGAQESIIEACLRAYIRERGEAARQARAEVVARVEALVDQWPVGDNGQDYRAAVTQCAAAIRAALTEARDE